MSIGGNPHLILERELSCADPQYESDPTPHMSVRTDAERTADREHRNGGPTIRKKEDRHLVIQKWKPCCGLRHNFQDFAIFKLVQGLKWASVLTYLRETYHQRSLPGY